MVICLDSSIESGNNDEQAYGALLSPLSHACEQMDHLHFSGYSASGHQRQYSWWLRLKGHAVRPLRNEINSISSATDGEFSLESDGSVVHSHSLKSHTPVEPESSMTSTLLDSDPRDLFRVHMSDRDAEHSSE